MIIERDGNIAVFLVNSSDSFFASHKKIWRNIEESFEAHAAIDEVRVYNIALISQRAKNQLFDIAAGFFSRQFVLCDIDEHATNTRARIERAAFEEARTNKREILNLFLRGEWATPDGLDGFLACLREFFAGPWGEPPLWQGALVKGAEISRFRRTLPIDSRLFVDGSSYDRKGVMGLSIFYDHLDSWSPIVTRNDGRAEIPPELASLAWMEDHLRLWELHFEVTVHRRPTGHISLQNIPRHIVSTLRGLPAPEITAQINSVIDAHEEIRILIDGARNWPLACEMATAFLAISNNAARIAQHLFECAETGSTLGISNGRNWILDLLLIYTKKSQTDVQHNISISRLTSVATRSASIRLEQAREIVAAAMQGMTSHEASLADDLARKYMKDRLYSLETNSYARPIYCATEQMLNRICSRTSDIAFDGFPRRNSVKYEAWHNHERSAGDIKNQFYVYSVKQPSRHAIIRVCSWYDTNPGNKRKEIAAKGRIMAVSGRDNLWRENSELFRGLILDGEWTGPQGRPFKYYEMMLESGWDLVLSIGHIAKLEKALLNHFGING